jgi:excisionase family DNA binding protein
MNDTILTIPEVSKILKLSRAKVYQMVKRRKIPHIRLGKNVRILESDLMRWIEECKVIPN